MRRSEAPPPGWYPDPTGGSQLWWWDGLDWTDHRRAPINALPPRVPAGTAVAPEEDDAGPPARVRAATTGPRTRDETAAIMAEVRKVAREEVDRAVDRVADRARDATRRLEPLIGQYGDRVLRWIRNLGIIVVAALVVWVLLQTLGQVAFMDWLGDRVDNLFGAASVVEGAGPSPGT